MTSGEHARRIERLRAALDERGADAAYITGLANVRYHCGFAPLPDERLCALVLARDGEPVLVLPALEEEHAREETDGIELRAFSDEDGPAQALSAALDAIDAQTLALEKSVVTIAELEQLEALRPGLRSVDLSPELARLRMVKSALELDLLQRAAEVADRAVAGLVPLLRAGASERQVAFELDRLLRSNGAQEAAFPSLVLSGPSGAQPHGVPGERELAPGDLVVVDLGAMIEGYRSDMTRTFSIGPPSPRAVELHGAVREAQDAGCRAVRSGATCASVDRVVRGIIEGHGLGQWFVHRTGHGLGLDEHELPSLMAGDDTLLADDMVVTVEPGVYLPGVGGVRIEDAVRVGASGDARLTHASRELVVCG